MAAIFRWQKQVPGDQTTFRDHRLSLRAANGARIPHQLHRFGTKNTRRTNRTSGVHFLLTCWLATTISRGTDRFSPKRVPHGNPCQWIIRVVLGILSPQPLNTRFGVADRIKTRKIRKYYRRRLSTKIVCGPILCRGNVSVPVNQQTGDPTDQSDQR